MIMKVIVSTILAAILNAKKIKTLAMYKI